MISNVYWMLELDVKAGREGDFRALMAEMVGATQANDFGERREVHGRQQRQQMRDVQKNRRRDLGVLSQHA